MRSMLLKLQGWFETPDRMFAYVLVKTLVLLLLLLFLSGLDVQNVVYMDF